MKADTGFFTFCMEGLMADNWMTHIQREVLIMWRMVVVREMCQSQALSATYAQRMRRAIKR